MTAPSSPLLPLRTLLHQTGMPAAERIAALQEARVAAAGDGDLAHDLLAADLAWLERHAGGLDPALGSELANARVAWLEVRCRGLAATAHQEPAALFDLADTEVAAVRLGAQELAERCRAARTQAAATIPVDPRLCQEAAERRAALLAAVEELPLDQQVALLRCHGGLVAALAARSGERTLRATGRRLLRAADDRELARRLEQRLGRRGVAVLESINMALLLVVLVVLVVQTTMDVTPETAWWLACVDAIACTFFLVDFTCEFALHPARWSWALRNALTDLLPAVPSVLFWLPGDALGASGLGGVRVLRFLRVTWAARYVQALRPLLRSARLLLFLVRGMDGLVRRFQALLHCDFVLVGDRGELQRSVAEEDRRDLTFAALQVEHELLPNLPEVVRHELLASRVAAVQEWTARLQVRRQRSAALRAGRRVPLEEVIETLWTLRPQDLGRWLERNDVRALDRVVRVVSAVPVRWLPIVRAFAVRGSHDTAEERIVACARRIADWLDAWHRKLLFYGDLHGIVTGPQILDRVATAMVKATQRPAVRLLLFGGLFLLFDQLIHSETISRFLQRIVATPLIVLGSVCLVFLTLGRWLKRLAGEAAEAYRLTSEAHFLPQLERSKLRFAPVDLPFLAQRVFGGAAAEAAALLQRQVADGRTGVPLGSGVLAHDCNQLALLYHHYLDGAPLHETDGKTTEQFLAHRSLENLRSRWLRCTKRERKQLKRLKLDEGSLFGGPYLWFSFITESVAVEVAKRIDGYNRYCLPLGERGAADPAADAAMDAWLAARADPNAGRTLAERQSNRAAPYATGEFTALDFLAAEPARDAHLAQVFGPQVLAVLQRDRRTMVREIFGMRGDPAAQPVWNPLRFYERRLSHGRVLLAPLWLLWRALHTVGWFVVRLRQIVREVIDPETAMRERRPGRASFAVALRKIHRMRLPGLLEAMRMRLLLDPEYAGAAAGWRAANPSAAPPPFVRDLAFLHLHDRACVAFHDQAALARRQVLELHALLELLPPFPPTAEPEARAAGELAVTSAWLADVDDVRSLLRAERWRAQALPELLAAGAGRGFWRRLGYTVRGWFAVSLVDRWWQQHGRELPAAALPALRFAFAHDWHGGRAVLQAWAKLPSGSSPTATALQRLHTVYRQGPRFQRDLRVLRAVQSLMLLDLRNYRELVFRIGGYEADGEDPALATALP
ncbi:MAG: hypothetical protein JNK49_05400 [Planctomycetes bacterium]|nr:hypothetical protein [Planctomycetota bacterium]